MASPTSPRSDWLFGEILAWLSSTLIRKGLVMTKVYIR